MQGIVAATGEIGINGDQVLHLADLGRENDLVTAHAEAFGALGGQKPGLDNRFAHDGRC